MCGYGALWTYSSDDPREALRLRGALVRVLAKHEGWPVPLSDAALIFVELVGNVLEHAPGPIRVTVACDNRKLELRVEDQGSMFEFAPKLPNAMAEDGRGLFLVGQLADNVRFEEDPPWKAVIAELPTG